MLEDASQNGRIGYVLDRYDVLLRTGGAASDVLFDVLGTALREDAILPHLKDRLIRRPPWAEQFWLRVVQNAGGIANVGRLRLSLLDLGVDNPAENDADILQRLVGNGHFDIAFSLYRRLSADESDRSALVRNDEFAKPARFAPFEWETFSASDYSSEVDASTGALVIYSGDSVSSLLARQLIEPMPGRYILRYRILDDEQSNAIQTMVRGRCVNAGGPELFSMPLREASGAMAVTVPGSDCRYLWLEIWAGRDAVASESTSSQVTIDRITMEPVR